MQLIMNFKPNFELNFRPSVSPFRNDKTEGLTHGSAGLSTEFIIVDDDSGIMPKILPYGDEDFLNAESRGKCGEVRSSYREKIRSFVRDYATARGSDCAKNEQLRKQLTKWKDGIGIPTEVNGVKMGRASKHDRAACFREEASVQLQNVNAAIVQYCLASAGSESLAQAELELQAAQQDLLLPNIDGRELRAEQKMDISTPLLILGGAVLVGGLAYFLIRR